MNVQSVYQYQSARQYLLDYVGARQRENPRFSLRGLARRMGVSNSWLVLVLQNKRRLRAEHATTFARAFELGPNERLYFQTLIHLERARTLNEKQMHAQNLQVLHPTKDFRVGEIEEFQILSNWIHFAILSVLDLAECDGSERSIISRLSKRAPASEIRASIERLAARGLLKRETDGRVTKVFDWVSSKNDAGNEGARKFHRGCAELAVAAIDEQPAEIRENQSFSFAIRKDKFPLAREMIRNFRNQLTAAVSASDGDEVYQMNMQFFQLTESAKRIALARRKAPRPTRISSPRSIE